MIESIDNAIDEGWPAQIDLLRELIRIPSLTGSERRVQERVALAMSDCGLTVDSWCPTFADVKTILPIVTMETPWENGPLLSGPGRARETENR